MFRWLGLAVLLAGLILFFGREFEASLPSKMQTTIPNTQEENLPLVTLQSTELPPTPFLVDWCQGEDCEELTTRNVVCDSNMHQQADQKSEVVGKISAGEIVKERTLFTKILKLGSYAVDENNNGSILTYAGAGVWATFFKGKFAALEWDNEEKRRKVKFDLPHNEGWILVRNQANRTGFVQTFDGQDQTPCPLLVAPHAIQTTDGED